MNKMIIGFVVAGVVLIVFSYWARSYRDTSSVPAVSSEYKNMDWSMYKKPTDAELKEKLSPAAYTVTQKEGTETPYTSPYTDSTEVGIYVDVVSGEPLFLSKDKYHSGTGWPSFVKPIRPDAVTYIEDKALGVERTEVRSRYADSHLGHVFTDGPVERGGKRYCMNGVALAFIPKEEMEKAGYGEYLREL